MVRFVLAGLKTYPKRAGFVPGAAQHGDLGVAEVFVQWKAVRHGAFSAWIVPEEIERLARGNFALVDGVGWFIELAAEPEQFRRANHLPMSIGEIERLPGRPGGE